MLIKLYLKKTCCIFTDYIYYTGEIFSWSWDRPVLVDSNLDQTHEIFGVKGGQIVATIEQWLITMHSLIEELYATWIRMS